MCFCAAILHKNTSNSFELTAANPAKSVTFMNRIQLLEQTKPSRRSVAAKRKRPFSPANRNSGFEHSFFVPLHYEANYAYPLLVWLHGPCDNHRQIRQVMPHVSQRNYVGVSVDSPTQTRDLMTDPQPWRQSVSSITESLRRVDEVVSAASNRFNVNPNRVFLAGFDCGGTMALRLGMAAPHRFAGVASIGGAFPDSHHPMSNLLQVRRLPLMIAHGRDSEIYPIARICEELRLFHVAGMSLNLRQYPCGHELTTQMLIDLDAWMMEIVTKVPCRTE